VLAVASGGSMDIAILIIFSFVALRFLPVRFLPW